MHPGSMLLPHSPAAWSRKRSAYRGVARAGRASGSAPTTPASARAATAGARGRTRRRRSSLRQGGSATSVSQQRGPPKATTKATTTTERATTTTKKATTTTKKATTTTKKATTVATTTAKTTTKNDDHLRCGHWRGGVGRQGRRRAGVHCPRSGLWRHDVCPAVGAADPVRGWGCQRWVQAARVFRGWWRDCH